MEKRELKAEDILVKSPIKAKKKELEIAQEVEQDLTDPIPSNYIEVKLSSLGILDMPAIVHVRDYTYNEALMMAEMKEEKITEGMIAILNNIVFEDLDMGKAHKQDVTEILLSIYGTWYSPVLETFNYFVDPNLKGEEKNAKENISVATIPIQNINTTPLDDKLVLPITFRTKGFEAQMILPRIENDIIAWKYATKKNLATEVKIANSIKAVKADKYTDEQMEEYESFIGQRGKDFMMGLQCQLIYSLNGKVLTKFSEKLEALEEIPLSLWRTYNDIVKTKFDFGVSEEVKFECSVTHKEITREFRFRPIHFLPILDKENDSRFEVSFG